MVHARKVQEMIPDELDKFTLIAMPPPKDPKYRPAVSKKHLTISEISGGDRWNILVEIPRAPGPMNKEAIKLERENFMKFWRETQPPKNMARDMYRKAKERMYTNWLQTEFNIAETEATCDHNMMFKTAYPEWQDDNPEVRFSPIVVPTPENTKFCKRFDTCVTKGLKAEEGKLLTKEVMPKPFKTPTFYGPLNGASMGPHCPRIADMRLSEPIDVVSMAHPSEVSRLGFDLPDTVVATQEEEEDVGFTRQSMEYISDNAVALMTFTIPKVIVEKEKVPVVVIDPKQLAVYNIGAPDNREIPTDVMRVTPENAPFPAKWGIGVVDGRFVPDVKLDMRTPSASRSPATNIDIRKSFLQVAKDGRVRLLKVLLRDCGVQYGISANPSQFQPTLEFSMRVDPDPETLRALQESLFPEIERVVRANTDMHPRRENTRLGELHTTEDGDEEGFVFYSGLSQDRHLYCQIEPVAKSCPLITEHAYTMVERAAASSDKQWIEIESIPKTLRLQPKFFGVDGKEIRNPERALAGNARVSALMTVEVSVRENAIRLNWRLSQVLVRDMGSGNGSHTQDTLTMLPDDLEI